MYASRDGAMYLMHPLTCIETSMSYRRDIVEHGDDISVVPAFHCLVTIFNKYLLYY